MNPYSTELCHHGILGQRWGKKNGPPYPLGSDVSTGSRLKKTFVSGSSKTQDPNSEYYKKKLPSQVRRELNSKMRSGNTILVGDAPGIDRQVQDYLKKKDYKNVEVYSPGKQSRYLADKSWKNNLIDDPKHEPGSPEWLAKKDKAMTKDADDGIAVVLPNGGARATRNNIERLQNQNKPVSVYELKTNDPNFKKKVAIGAAIAGTALAAAGGYYMYKTGKLDSLISLGKSKNLVISDEIKQMAKANNIPLRSDMKSAAHDAIHMTNPNYGKNFAYSNNCVASSIAHCAERLGMNVTAKPLSEGKYAHGFTTDELRSTFKGMLPDTLTTSSRNAKGIQNDLAKQILMSCDEGHNVGMFTIKIPDGNGHAISWEKLPGKNKISFYDPATKNGKANKYFQALAQSGVKAELSSIRLDDCAIQGKELLELFCDII